MLDVRGHASITFFLNTNFCATGGAKSRDTSVTMRITNSKGKTREVSFPRMRINAFRDKFHIMSNTYGIDEKSARQVLIRIAKVDWRKRLNQLGIDSPYDLSRDQLTKFLVSKPGAVKVGTLRKWDRIPKNQDYGDPFLKAYVESNPGIKVSNKGNPYEKEQWDYSLKGLDHEGKWFKGRMEKVATPVVHLHMRDFRRACDIVRDRYVDTVRQFLPPFEIQRDKSYKKTVRNSKGFFFHLGATKNDVWAHRDFKRATEQVLRRESPAFHMTFPKAETIKASKIASGAPRMIIGAALEMEIVERMATQAFAISQQKGRWDGLASKIGIHNNEWNRLYQQHQGRYVYGTDYSSQDLRMPRQFTHFSVDLRLNPLPKGSFVYNGKAFSWTDIQRVLSLGMSSSVWVGPQGEVYQRWHGIPSGMFNTASVNTTNHEVLNPYLELRSGVDLATVRSVVHSQYGDDNLKSSVRPYLNFEKMKMETEKIGMVFTVDAWAKKAPEFGSIPYELQFLQRGFTRMEDGKVSAIFDQNRVMSKFLNPHSVVATARQSFERALNFLNCLGNREYQFQQVCDYIKYLGYTPPTYEYIMRSQFVENWTDSIRSVKDSFLSSSSAMGLAESVVNWNLELTFALNANPSILAPVFTNTLKDAEMWTTGSDDFVEPFDRSRFHFTSIEYASYHTIRFSFLRTNYVVKIQKTGANVDKLLKVHVHKSTVPSGTIEESGGWVSFDAYQKIKISGGFVGNWDSRSLLLRCGDIEENPGPEMEKRRYASDSDSGYESKNKKKPKKEKCPDAIEVPWKRLVYDPEFLGQCVNSSLVSDDNGFTFPLELVKSSFKSMFRAGDTIIMGGQNLKLLWFWKTKKVDYDINKTILNFWEFNCALVHWEREGKRMRHRERRETGKTVNQQKREVVFVRPCLKTRVEERIKKTFKNLLFRVRMRMSSEKEEKRLSAEADLMFEERAREREAESSAEFLLKASEPQIGDFQSTVSYLLTVKRVCERHNNPPKLVEDMGFELLYKRCVMRFRDRLALLQDRDRLDPCYFCRLTHGSRGYSSHECKDYSIDIIALEQRDGRNNSGKSCEDLLHEQHSRYPATYIVGNDSQDVSYLWN
ncbi:RNA-dependent RNA polymerase [Fusarium poae yadokarivirus 1]|nr:RNA-dependent RNA polymerase [Fusarium poae yadokarivirus 1]